MIGITDIIRIGEKIFDRVIPDQEKAAEAKAKLVELAQSGKLKELEFEFQDRASARDREARIAATDAPMLSKIVTPVLALGTVGLSFTLFGILIFTEVRPEAKDVLIYILGALNSATTMVLAYYFGSSIGSKDKDDELRKILHRS